MLKVLVFSLSTPSNYAKRDGGASIVLRQLIMNWASHAKLVIIGARQPDTPIIERLGSATIIRVGGRYTAWLWMFILYSRYLQGWADIVIENRHSYPLLTPLYVREHLVVIEHGFLGIDYFRSTQPHLALLGFILEKLIGLLGYRKARFVTVSHLCAMDLCKVGIPQNKIDVVHPGIDIIHNPPGLRSPFPIVTFIGVMDDRRKRVEDLIYAFRRYVYPKYPNAKLVICGGGKREAIFKRVQFPNIIFCGYISGIKKAILLQASWIFVMPSVRETFSMACLEANAYGVPCVAYKIKGLETLKEGVNALLVKPRDKHELGKKIVYLIQDRERLKRLSVTSKRFASRLDWKITAQRILEILRWECGKYKYC